MAVKEALFLLFLLSVARGQNIVEIQAKTVDADDAGMDLGTVDLEIINMEFNTCDLKFPES